MDGRSRDLNQLGLGLEASDGEIAAAFRACAFESHPDRGGDGARMVELTEIRDRLLSESDRAPVVIAPRPEAGTVLTDDVDDVRAYFYFVPMVVVPALVLLIFAVIAW